MKQVCYKSCGREDRRKIHKDFTSRWYIFAIDVDKPREVTVDENG